VNEAGVNKVINHITRQRPSLFNYGTADVAANREQWCTQVAFTSDVAKHGNPIFTVEPFLPVLGADSPPVGLSFCVQVSRARIDFHPGNKITLPAELHPPLKSQRFSLTFKVCGAIGCPSDKEVFSIQPGYVGKPSIEVPQQKEVDLRGQLNCFCLDVYVIGHFEHALVAGNEALTGKVDDVDIVDIKPDALEDNLVCYIRTSLNVLLREKLTIPLKTFFFDFSLFGLATVTPSPSPNPPVANNPAIEDDQLKAFLDMKVGP
jgi:hypothetical protein